ncbi:translation elongation factor Ts [Vampirovibrio sp.]|uniref:translation elongation factor Ts n=1 Tax=Vampirovibrio sp. TaxID=2717857 RepID=UPI0035945F81
MEITASQVKELREKTGAGMMDAKKALVEAGGDMDKAAEVLRQKGIATAEKKSGRTAAEGQVAALISADAKTGALVEVNCETDFVAKGEAFLTMVSEVNKQVLEDAPASVEALLDQPSQALAGSNVQQYVTEKIAAIRENLSIRRFVRYQREGNGAVHSYIHTGGRVGVLIELKAGKPETASKDGFKQLLKDLAMQIASASPDFVTRADIDPAVIDEETRVEMGKEDLANKPEEIRRKIVDGRVSKILGQRCLIEQPFVKDPSQSVDDIIKARATELGDNEVEVIRFTRYALGEGIEKKETNFAEEVAAAARV